MRSSDAGYSNATGCAKARSLIPRSGAATPPRTMANYRRRRWRDTMTVHVDLNGLLAEAVGSDGLAADELAGLEPELARVRDDLATRRTAGALAFAELPYRRDEAR